jgi:spore maturation protein CgeB
MKILFSSNKNPHFPTITEYIENALQLTGCRTLFFNNRDFTIPGWLRDRVPYLHGLDIRMINNKLISTLDSFKPDVFIEAGGHRILPRTVEKIKREGITTVLWTIDPPRDVTPIVRAGHCYDFVFTGGSEAYVILNKNNINNLHFLPFACDHTLHKPTKVNDKDKPRYASDIAFVGSVDPGLYPHRVEILEGISDYNLSLWGPGVDALSKTSPLRPLILGRETPPQTWTKIYSQSKIVLCIHYRDPNGKMPCYQASPRVYEALACGAFLVVDDQKDVLSLFKDREELVVFRNIEELREILDFYLKRPGERDRVARRGREKVIKSHRYLDRVQTMLNLATK